MPVISFASSKGGGGKSTSALATALFLSEEGFSVTVIDADPNQPILSWYEGRADNKINVVGAITDSNIIDEIDGASQKSQIVIVDLEGSANSLVSFALSLSDLVIIPTTGSHVDTSEVAKTIKLIRNNGRASGRQILHSVLFTRVSYIKPRTITALKNLMRENGLPIFNTEMIERDAFKAIFAFNSTLHELNDNDVSQPGKAIQNIKDLCSEILSLIKENANA